MDEKPLRDALEAVLMFYKGDVWTYEDAQRWYELTGREEVTTRALCEVIRERLAH